MGGGEGREGTVRIRRLGGEGTHFQIRNYRKGLGGRSSNELNMDIIIVVVGDTSSQSLTDFNT